MSYLGNDIWGKSESEVPVFSPPKTKVKDPSSSIPICITWPNQVTISSSVNFQSFLPMCWWDVLESQGKKCCLRLHTPHQSPLPTPVPAACSTVAVAAMKALIKDGSSADNNSVEWVGCRERSPRWIYEKSNSVEFIALNFHIILHLNRESCLRLDYPYPI